MDWATPTNTLCLTSTVSPRFSQRTPEVPRAHRCSKVDNVWTSSVLIGLVSGPNSRASPTAVLYTRSLPDDRMSHWPSMFQIGEYQFSLPYTRGYFVRYATTRWNLNTLVTNLSTSPNPFLVEWGSASSQLNPAAAFHNLKVRNASQRWANYFWRYPICVIGAIFSYPLKIRFIQW